MYNGVLVTLRTTFFLKNGRAYAFFSFEQLGGFNPPDSSNERCCREELVPFSTRSVNFRVCEGIFSNFSTIMANSAVHQNDPRRISELLVEISGTIEQSISVIAPERAFVEAIGGSNPHSGSKIKLNKLPFIKKTPFSPIHLCMYVRMHVCMYIY